MIASLVLFESEFLNIVSISFSALVLNELIMVAVEVTTWHTLMILSEVITLAVYVISILFLPEYFGSSPLPLSSPSIFGFADGGEMDRPLVCVHGEVHLEGRPHRRHLGRAAVGDQDPQGQVRADAVRKAQGFLMGCLGDEMCSRGSEVDTFFLCPVRPGVRVHISGSRALLFRR